ncbi:hypothetical protein [Nocardia mangyaensis]|uniref:hypothetical protein n=1 Tax=Nocardia mangyaensis TaxID=2213200 RepID=UPI0026756801|nr:hypothetical protein [Nocardia mangyaensis]MDO3645867.1 hypothetical protein [Nocardia mangyaensis]
MADDDMHSMALHLRESNHRLRDIATRLVITKGKKKASTPHQPPSCGYCASTIGPTSR